ncbi:hypothetical protein LXA43DRAFT_132815 [Ganoderma leucocontextum]|nr:hypothetical protein LXA43DRAFT_132815 [Ganoderma leucocontextum]
MHETGSPPVLDDNCGRAGVQQYFFHLGGFHWAADSITRRSVTWRAGGGRDRDRSWPLQMQSGTGRRMRPKTEQFKRLHDLPIPSESGEQLSPTMALESGRYHIFSKLGDAPVGRRHVEDFSLFPKGVYKLSNGPEAPVWVVEKLPNGNYTLKTGGPSSARLTHTSSPSSLRRRRCRGRRNGPSSATSAIQREMPTL